MMMPIGGDPDAFKLSMMSMMKGKGMMDCNMDAACVWMKTAQGSG